MKNQFDLDKVIQNGEIRNELEHERALLADRKLRLLSKDDQELKSKRKLLRDIISKYEDKTWSDFSKISEQLVEESDEAEKIVEQEGAFIQNRKKLIKLKLKKLNLNQQEFGKILGHNSKSYMSELMNGVSPFSMKDLVVINRLLKIDLSKLIFTSISYKEQLQILSSIEKLKNPMLKLNKKDFALV